MTSLIDVIFLLLLFFMLTSTFSKFAEVELAAAAGTGTPRSDTPPLFVQLGPDQISLNGDAMTLGTLAQQLDATQKTTLIVALHDKVNAQRLTDLLVALKGFQNLTITVLGAS